MRHSLTDLCDIQYGFAFNSAGFTNDPTYPPLIRIRDVKRGYSETYYSGNYPEPYIIHAGDLLIFASIQLEKNFICVLYI